MFKLLLVSLLIASSLLAHDAPSSFVDLRLRADGLQISVVASATDFAHEFPNLDPSTLLQSATLAREQEALATLIQRRLRLKADGQTLRYTFGKSVPVPEKRDIRLEFSATWLAAPSTLTIDSQLFPYDPRHRTFLNLYENDRLQSQEIIQVGSPILAYRPGTRQALGYILLQFLLEGIHHIFIGPDHILFVIGLILPGTELRRMLKIVTAFTLAHSITLGMATFRIVSPPASFIEPAIALSVVVVGVNAFLGSKKHDSRLWLAFCFGLIHGFGFANVLQEMLLPRHALGWSLLTFNLGVELGQACIVLAIVPLLVWLQRERYPLWHRVVGIGSLGVMTMGAFWFFERVLG
jgi:hydrogenase/urease accessory protein HupE